MELVYVSIKHQMQRCEVQIEETTETDSKFLMLQSTTEKETIVPKHLVTLFDVLLISIMEQLLFAFSTVLENNNLWLVQ